MNILDGGELPVARPPQVPQGGPEQAPACAEIVSRLPGGDALLIVPPFCYWGLPSLGAHVLQACARAQGFRVDVLYANMLLTATLGDASYRAIGIASCSHALMGERFFAAAAYGGRPDDTACAWADEVAAAVAAKSYPVVGCTTQAQQTSAGVALLTRIKRLRPDTITVMGGANCAGEMARGVASLSPLIDYVCAGEAEACFPRLLAQARAGTLPSDRVLPGEPCQDLDALPAVHYGDYFEQAARLFPDQDPSAIWMPAQSSRGCWWGEKHPCTFCGCNVTGLTFREKTPDRVLEEVRGLVEAHPSRRIQFLDTIMPHTYFRTLLPRLATEFPDVRFCYEQKANLSLERLLLLKRAHVVEVQAGIEALSTPLLRRMGKGITGPQNVAVLRYARSAHVFLTWNLLYGLPGDGPEEYEETLALIPLLRHLAPPSSLCEFELDRFSPYFDDPAAYGISHVRPLPAYGEVYPSHADLSSLAYHFDAEFRSALRDDPGLAGRLEAAVGEWVDAWEGSGPVPELGVSRLTDDLFLLRDTRGLPGTKTTQLLGRDQARAALVGGRHLDPDAVEWALEHRVGTRLDGQYVPLATAGPELLGLLEQEMRRLRNPSSKKGGDPCEKSSSSWDS